MSPSGKPGNKHARGETGKGDTPETTEIVSVDDSGGVTPMWWRAERESMMDDLESRFEQMM